MNKIIYILLLSISMPIYGQTVTDEFFHNLIRQHASLYDKYINTNKQFAAEEYNTVTIEGNNNNTVGKYIFYEGSKTKDYGISSFGHLTLPHRGTIYGCTSYQRKSITGMKYNYSTLPTLSAPYFVSDSISSGRVRDEIYSVSGAYSRDKGKWSFGANTDYKGISRSRTDNPGFSAFSHNLGIGLSAALTRGLHTYSLKFTPSITRQSITSTTVGKAVKYFRFYGFGKYSRIESQGGRGFRRDENSEKLATSLLYIYQGPWRVTAELNGSIKWFETEENSFKNLFSSITTILNGRFTAERQYGRNRLNLSAHASFNTLSGCEYIYKSFVQDEELNLIDYEKIGSNEFYNSYKITIGTSAQLNLAINNDSRLILNTSVDILSIGEEYKIPLSEYDYIKAIPQMSLGWKHRHKKWQSELKVRTGYIYTFNKEITLSTDENKSTDIMVNDYHDVLSADYLISGCDFIIERKIKNNKNLGIRIGGEMCKSDISDQYTASASLYLKW